MPHSFMILLKMNLLLALFFTAYYFILRKLTFYSTNRFFLVSGVLFSAVYPFLDLTAFWQNQYHIYPVITEFVPTFNGQGKADLPARFMTKYQVLTNTIFWAGVAFINIKFLLQLVSLFKLHNRSKPGLIENYQVQILNEPVSPFSFWQTIYINPSLYNKTALENILAHEKVHLKDWHTLDIILMELSTAFYWFNPAIWLMKKAVKENLEFITDNKILKMGFEKKEYQYSLLFVGHLRGSAPVGNNFSFAHLKKRIDMMNTKRSSSVALSRYFLLLPALLLITLAFTVSKKTEKPNPLQTFLQQRPYAGARNRNLATKQNKTSKVKNNGLVLRHGGAKSTPGFYDSQKKQEERTLKESFHTDHNKVITASSVRTPTGLTSLYEPTNHFASDSVQSAVDKPKLGEEGVITVIGYRTPEEARAARQEKREALKATAADYQSGTLPASTNYLPSKAAEKTYKVVTGYKLPRP